MSKVLNFIHKLTLNRNLVSILGVLIGTSIYSFAVVFLLDLGEFYAGGVTGVTQLIAKIVGNRKIESYLIVIINIPLFLLGWKGVSKRFAIFSLAAVAINSIEVYIFHEMVSNGINPFKNIIDTNIAGDMLLLTLIGGLLTGLGCGITLRSGTSTGGMDIISQTFSLKTGIHFTVISGTVDIIIIIAGTIVAGDLSIALYTVIRLITHIITLDKIHTIYNYQKLTIVVNDKESVSEILKGRFLHGFTVYPAIGGYTNKHKWVIETVIMTFEIEEYRDAVLSVEPQAFISYTPVKGVVGQYNRRSYN